MPLSECHSDRRCHLNLRAAIQATGAPSFARRSHVSTTVSGFSDIDSMP